MIRQKEQLRLNSINFALAILEILTNPCTAGKEGPAALASCEPLSLNA